MGGFERVPSSLTKMNSDLRVVNAINRRLHKEYRVLDGRPIYRIVWSEDELELRKGKFTDWYGSIFIREYFAVKRVRKYWHLKNPCYVLEKLIFIRGKEELKEIASELLEVSRGSYEPLYTFCDSESNPLPVNWKVVDLILYTLHHPVKRTESDARADLLKEEMEETKYFEEKIGEGERSPLFVWENSVAVSSNQLEYKESIPNGKV